MEIESFVIKYWLPLKIQLEYFIVTYYGLLALVW